MLELKKQLIAAYLEFSEKCKCENCIECLYDDAPLPKCEALLLADFLISSGLFTTPAIPGQSDADPNIMELCFRNGENHMRDKIKTSLMKLSADMPCVTISQVIKILEDLQ
jgi:hypothetical protein